MFSADICPPAGTGEQAHAIASILYPAQLQVSHRNKQNLAHCRQVLDFILPVNGCIIPVITTFQLEICRSFSPSFKVNIGRGDEAMEAARATRSRDLPRRRTQIALRGALSRQDDLHPNYRSCHAPCWLRETLEPHDDGSSVSALPFSIRAARSRPRQESDDLKSAPDTPRLPSFRRTLRHPQPPGLPARELETRLQPFVDGNKSCVALSTPNHAIDSPDAE
jgi:hypothetical protein